MQQHFKQGHEANAAHQRPEHVIVNLIVEQEQLIVGRKVTAVELFVSALPLVLIKIPVQSPCNHEQGDDIACPYPRDPGWFYQRHLRGRWQKQLRAENSHRQYNERAAQREPNAFQPAPRSYRFRRPSK